MAEIINEMQHSLEMAGGSVNVPLDKLVTDFEQGPAQKLDAWQMMVQVRKQNKAENGSAKGTSVKT